MKEYIEIKNIVQCFNTKDSNNLLCKKTRQIGLNEAKITTFENNGYIILDFGKELNGSIRILTYSGNNVKVRLRFGESLTETCAEIGEKNATNDHSNRDFYVYLNRYSDMRFGNLGFRFLRVDFFDKVTIKSIFAENYIFKKKTISAYNFKDREIENIFQVAKRTIDLCASEEYLWDGIKRDRLVWIGDMYPEMLALTALYGKLPIIERSLDFVKNQTPLPNWMNRISSYSLWWIIIVADYYKRTNSVEFTKKQLNYLVGLINQIDKNVDENGNMSYPDYFIDWDTFDTPASKSGVRALNIIACKKAIDIFNSFNIDTSIVEKILNRLNKQKIITYDKKQVIALKYWAIGTLTNEEKDALVKGNSAGLTTFMSYYIINAIDSFSREKAIEIMKEYFGGMISKGATTFWEDFNIEWMKNSSNLDEFPEKNQKDIHGDFGKYCYKGFRHSLCHGWACGIIEYIKYL